MTTRNFFIQSLCFLILSASLQAQCLVHNRNDGIVSQATCGGTDIVGQTFMPCQDGVVTSISVTHSTQWCTPEAGTYDLYIAEDPGSGTPIPATPVASVTLASNASNLQVSTFNLTTPFAVETGTLYRFVIENDGGASEMNFRGDNNDYPDGTFINVNNNYSPSTDLDFEVQIQPNLEVPTLSQWGLINLALLLMIGGVVYLRKPIFQ